MQSSNRLSQLPPRRSRRGQTMVEFALTLPILLLLMFGIIEFGRIFQAWVTIQNAARTAARYAITGNYDQTWFPDDLGAIDQAWNPTPDNLITYPAGPTNLHGVPCPLPSAPTLLNGGADELNAANIYTGDPTASDQFFRSHWNGMDCDPANIDHQHLRNDILRLVSMTKAGQAGAAGLQLHTDCVRIPGLGINTENHCVGAGYDSSNMPGWFNVFVCSSRPPLDPKSTLTYRYSQKTSDWQQRKCLIQEPDPAKAAGADYDAPGVNFIGGDPNKPRNQYDAGGPGDFVTVIVFFNHPLITPLNVNTLGGSGPLAGGQMYIPLQASRTMVNEAFRKSTVINLPGQGYATYTPTNTLTPTKTFTPTNTATITSTNTRTPSPTYTLPPTLTPTPACPNVSLNSNVTFTTTGGYVQLSVTNSNVAPVLLMGTTLKWTLNGTWPSMYLYQVGLQGQYSVWTWDTVNPSQAPGATTGSFTINTSSAGWNGGTAPNFSIRAVNGGGATTIIQYQLNNGPANLGTIFSKYDFGGTSLTFDLGSGQTCTVSLSSPSATPNPTYLTPTSGTPVCAGSYSMSFTAFQDLGLVRFSFTNSTAVPAVIKGFSLQWRSYFGGMTLVGVAAKSTSPYFPDAIPVWNGSTTTPPTTATSADPNWNSSPAMDPNSTQNFWFDFDGTSGNLGALYGALPSDFNGTTVTLANGCVVTVNPFATPLGTITNTPTASQTYTPSKTNTATATYTASITLTPSKTNTATATYTASITLTPSKTNTPTLTYTPSSTKTPTQTYTPSKTFTPSYTPSITNTPTKTYTPSPTFTRTPTFTPTLTYTPSKTYTPTNTYTPSNTPTKTFTPTATNTPLPPTFTFTPTATYTRTHTPVPSNTFTPTFTPTATFTPTKTNTAPVTNTFTPSPTTSPSPTATDPSGGHDG